MVYQDGFYTHSTYHCYMTYAATILRYTCTPVKVVMKSSNLSMKTYCNNKT